VVARQQDLCAGGQVITQLVEHRAHERVQFHQFGRDQRRLAGVPRLVAQEVLVQREPAAACGARQHAARLFRRARRQVEAARDQFGIGEILVDRASGRDILHREERQVGRQVGHRGGRKRQLFFARQLPEPRAEGVEESRRHATQRQRAQHRVIEKDVTQRLVRKSGQMPADGRLTVEA